MYILYQILPELFIHLSLMQCICIMLDVLMIEVMHGRISEFQSELSDLACQVEYDIVPHH
jgi:hypothetical protein